MNRQSDSPTYFCAFWQCAKNERLFQKREHQLSRNVPVYLPVIQIEKIHGTFPNRYRIP